MTDKHTKGPWRWMVNDYPNEEKIWDGDKAPIYGFEELSPCVLTRTAEGHICCDNEYDANLIAAAPDLLGWLEKAVQMARQQAQGGCDIPMRSAWSWLADNGGAAIAKAKGTKNDN